MKASSYDGRSQGFRLRKDLVIPAGTIFDAAPTRIEMDESYVEYTIGLTKDSAGSLLYSVDPNDPELVEWFEPIVEPMVESRVEPDARQA